MSTSPLLLFTRKRFSDKNDISTLPLSVANQSICPSHASTFISPEDVMNCPTFAAFILYPSSKPLPADIMTLSPWTFIIEKSPLLPFTFTLSASTEAMVTSPESVTTFTFSAVILDRYAPPFTSVTSNVPQDICTLDTRVPVFEVMDISPYSPSGILTTT